MASALGRLIEQLQAVEKRTTTAEGRVAHLEHAVLEQEAKLVETKGQLADAKEDLRVSKRTSEEAYNRFNGASIAAVTALPEGGSARRTMATASTLVAQSPRREPRVHAPDDESEAAIPV